MTTLHQTTAILKSVKSRLYAEVTALFKEAQKPDPYNGQVKAYRKKDDASEEFNEPGKKVTMYAEDVLKKLAKLEGEVLDLVAEQETANTLARADVVVNGQTLIKDAPVTLLLALEKRFTDIRTFIDKMPVLDDAKDWATDPNSHLFKTTPVTTHKTKKVQRAIVKYDAVIKDGQALPAQTEMITDDVTIGWWDTTFLSGALPIPRKEALLDRVDKLLRAVKVARETANSQEVNDIKVGDPVFGFLLAP